MILKPYDYGLSKAWAMNEPKINLEKEYLLPHETIKLKRGMADTLKVHINQASITPSTNMDSVWYNGVLKHYDSTSTFPIVR